MSQYRILTNQDDSWPLAERSAKVVRSLRKLQIDSTYYTVQERYVMAKEMLWDDWIEKEEVVLDDGEETGEINYQMKPAALNRYDFMDAAAMMLFPLAPIDKNKEHIDYEVLEQALEDFTTRIDRKKRRLSALFG